MAKVRRKDALDFHRAGRPGKIEVIASKPLTSQRDLSLAYSPGVAEPCLEIAKDPDTVYEYTARGNLVAVITNGTAVLGLGDIGPLASKPVMEGKGVLFKKFADIDVFDLEIAETDPDRFIQVVAALEPTFGGINLEDIKAPECFYIEQELQRRMSIPVFHDDQHGTAIISGAALINAAHLQGKDLATLKMVVSGAGASAIACTRFYVALGVARENITMCDSKGPLHLEREGLDESKQEFVRDTKARTLGQALEGADLFLGLSRGGLVTPDMIVGMASNPIIFALANPDPEIGYEEAKATRPDAIVATGRSDYANQVNNVLGFPGIFRGALDVRASRINEDMKIAAARALAELARKDVPQSVHNVYGGEFSFGPDYIIPKPFDPRVIEWVAPAVADAAVSSGVARIPYDAVAYRERLAGLLGGATAVMRRFVRAAQKSPRSIVFPEGYDHRVLRAVDVMVEDGIARPILLGSRERIAEICREHDIGLDLDAVSILDPETDANLDGFVEQYWNSRARKGVTQVEARHLMRTSPNYFGMMMVRHGLADGLVSGMTTAYPETIRPALHVIGIRPELRTIAGMYVLLHRSGLQFFADTTVNVETSAEELVDIAELVAEEVRKTFDLKPRVAMLSYSNFGSSRTPSSEKTARAVEMLRQRQPDLEVEGEMQANVAVDYAMQKRLFPHTRLTGPANVFIFPNLEAGNVAYKLMRELGGVPAVGPLLLGLRSPVTVLERDSTVDTVVQMTALTTTYAQRLERERNTASGD